tara:strand:- start:1486 stop:1677 length:192 start_codon:yes stop_codon:yes gene_type:complete
VNAGLQEVIKKETPAFPRRLPASIPPELVGTSTIQRRIWIFFEMEERLGVPVQEPFSFLFPLL